jgi:hypothetical protein
MFPQGAVVHASVSAPRPTGKNHGVTIAGRNSLLQRRSWPSMAPKYAEAISTERGRLDRWKPVAGGSGAPLLLCKRSERSSSSAPNRAARHSAHFGFSRKATRLGPFTEGRPVSCRPKTALWAEPGRNALQNKDPTRKPIHDARPYLIRICAWLMNWWHT